MKGIGERIVWSSGRTSQGLSPSQWTKPGQQGANPWLYQGCSAAPGSRVSASCGSSAPPTCCWAPVGHRDTALSIPPSTWRVAEGSGRAEWGRTVGSGSCCGTCTGKGQGLNELPGAFSASLHLICVHSSEPHCPFPSVLVLLPLRSRG